MFDTWVKGIAHSARMWPLLFAFVSVYFVLRSVYRLYLHPLSKIPGPRIAAITSGYEFYYDVLRHGMYIWEIEKMHEKYGQSRQI